MPNIAFVRRIALSLNRGIYHIVAVERRRIFLTQRRRDFTDTLDEPPGN